MIKRQLVAALSAVVCAIATVPISHATAETTPIVDEGFIPNPTQSSVGRQGVKMMEQPDYIETASVLRGHPTSTSGRWKSCSSLADPNCSSAQKITFGAILQPCLTATSIDCVSGFGVIASDGTKTSATFERKFPAEALNKFPADPVANLPEGGPGALWSLPASAGLPASLHYVRASVVGSVKSNKAVFEGFAASLTPVSMTMMSCNPNSSFVRVGKNECTSGDYQTDRDEPGYSGFVYGSGWADGLDCEMSGNANYSTETAECAQRKPASLDTKYYLEVRISQSPQGWLHGRLADADVTITSIPGVPGAVSLSVAGKPVRVPVVFKELPFGELPLSLQDKYLVTGGWPGGLGGASNWGPKDTDPYEPTGRNRLSIPPPYGAPGIEELQAWMGFLNDTSTADRATWSIRTLRQWERDQASSCLTDTSRVTGLVLTNATQYLAGAPAYNSTTKSLDYQVAAPHFMSNGQVFKGSYQMIVRSDVARCIYGFSSIDSGATVSVVESESGQSSTAVYSVSESNGWFNLSASGYTHSAPIIRAIFTGTKTASIKPSSKAAISVKVKSSLSPTKLARVAKLKTSKSSKIAITVARSSAKVCRVQSKSLRALKKGRCQATVTVTTGKKKVKKSILITVK